MGKGLNSKDVKAITEAYGLDFSESSFSLSPPILDQFMDRRVKAAGSSRKAIESAEKTWISVQLKLMDIGAPLVALYDGLKSLPDQGPADPITEAVRASLKLWAEAFYDVTRRRRRNIVSQVDPRYEFLLTSSKAFSGRKRSDLFGERFIDEMVKDAELTAKLNHRDVLASSARTRSQASSRRGRQQHTHAS